MSQKIKGWNFQDSPLTLCPVYCTHYASKFWLIAGPGGEDFLAEDHSARIRLALCTLAGIQEDNHRFVIVQLHIPGIWACEVVGPANQQMRHNSLGNPPNLGDAAHFLGWLQGGMETALRQPSGKHGIIVGKTMPSYDMEVTDEILCDVVRSGYSDRCTHTPPCTNMADSAPENGR